MITNPLSKYAGLVFAVLPFLGCSTMNTNSTLINENREEKEYHQKTRELFEYLIENGKSTGSFLNGTMVDERTLCINLDAGKLSAKALKRQNGSHSLEIEIDNGILSKTVFYDENADGNVDRAYSWHLFIYPRLNEEKLINLEYRMFSLEDPGQYNQRFQKYTSHLLDIVKSI